MGKARKDTRQLQPVLFLVYEGSVLASGEKEWNLMKPARNDLEQKHTEYSNEESGGGHESYSSSLLLRESTALVPVMIFNERL